MAASIAGNDVNNIRDVTVFMTFERSMRNDGQLLKDYVVDVLPDDMPPKPHSSETNSTALEVEEAMHDGQFEDRLHCCQKLFYLIGMFLYRVLSNFYTIYYYYFAPFTVFILIIYSQIKIDRENRELAAAASK